MESLADWVDGQTNRALQSMEAVEYAYGTLVERELPLHHDRPKNWDNFLALYHTWTTTSYDVPILDAGAGRDSVYLPGLKRSGYTKLTGVNLDRHDDADAGMIDGINYAYGDITRPEWPTATFGFVACLSVIEHGVDVKLFLKEMGRIIRPGGHLFVSFDYWIDKIDTAGRRTHDAPLNIFSCSEAMEFLVNATEVGLGIVGDVDLGCKDIIIDWAGIKYTFANLLFRRRDYAWT
jgi:SAM-dependent methyltransferase